MSSLRPYKCTKDLIGIILTLEPAPLHGESNKWSTDPIGPVVPEITHLDILFYLYSR